MNEKYLVHKDEAIVFDENEKATVMPNYNNLEDILKKENLIEEIEYEIERVKNIMENIEILGLKKKKNFAGLICFGLCTLLCIVLTAGNAYEQPELNRNLMEIMSSNAYIIMPMACITLVASPFIHFIYMRADPQKEFNGYKCKLNFLNDKLSKEKEELAKLKQNSRLKDDDKTPVKVTTIRKDIDELLSLKHALISCYDIGYDLDKYYEYLEDETLDERIKGMGLEDSGAQLIKKFISEQKRPK